MMVVLCIRETTRICLKINNVKSHSPEFLRPDLDQILGKVLINKLLFVRVSKEEFTDQLLVTTHLCLEFVWAHRVCLGFLQS